MATKMAFHIAAGEEDQQDPTGGTGGTGVSSGEEDKEDPQQQQQQQQRPRGGAVGLRSTADLSLLLTRAQVGGGGGWRLSRVGAHRSRQ